jgi:capsular exopolysaccharide synthesis family protein
MSRLFEALQQSTNSTSEPDIADAIAALTDVSALPVASSRARTVALPHNATTRLVALGDARSPGAERFRVLATRLKQVKDTIKLKKILVTSCIRNEGKSVITANLAISLAASGDKVLLIDGDLRQPTLEELLEIAEPTGVADWDGEDGVSAMMYRIDGLGLWFLAAGRPPAHPLEVLSAERISALMSQVSDTFDWILVDSPPVIPFADTTLWAAACDHVIMIVREGVTPRNLLKKAVEAIDRQKLLGAILNESSDTKDSYYREYHHRDGASNPPRRSAVAASASSKL